MSSNDPNNNSNNGINNINRISPSPLQRSNSTSSQRGSSSGLTRSPSSAEFVNFMGTPTGANDQPPSSNRIETIRQYYHQLTNNIRLIQQQLQIPDLPPARRQALLVEQARVNAAMQEFTEKILKPITAQKQQQQQQQMRMAQAQAAANARFLPQQQQQQQWQTQQATRPPLLSSAQKQQTPQRPPATINLSSQVGMGMIRPIMTSAPSGASVPPSPSRYRPAVPVAAAPLPPSTPTKAQQLLINRQSYLQAAHQHQTTIRQQQSAFQQRLAIFSRDVQGARIQKAKAKAPVFALSTSTSSLLKNGNSRPTSPNRRNDSPLRTIKSALYSVSSIPGKTSSLSATHSTSTLSQLARVVNPTIVLQKSAQKRIFQMADVFTEQLVKQACTLALHRGGKQLSVEDVQLALDLSLNYQPAGQGSIENCRPPKKPQLASLNATESATTSSTGGSLAHHHRMAVIKKHASLYNSHQGRINED